VSDVIHGHCDPRFDKLRDAFARAITSGEDLGAAIAVDIDGEMVVDIWGGHADAAKARDWDEDTIVNLWSCTTPVATYWPEFAANGKQDIEVRHVLSYTSGVSGWEAPFTAEDMYDWEKATTQLARQAPWWPPGTASGYHLVNYGHLVGEIVRRITGQDAESAVIMNPDRRATFAYVMNKMGPGTTGSVRTQTYTRLFYEALA
jgi:CubicO group peptidase (beta-lactamase class C family)